MAKRHKRKLVAKEVSAKNKAFWDKIKSVRIGTDHFDVVFKKNVQGGKCMGEMCHDDREIVLDEELKSIDSLLPVSTLFHEICHGIERTFLEFDDDDKEYDKKSEFLIDMISESLVMVLSDNLEVFRVILDRIEERKRKYEGGAK